MRRKAISIIQKVLGLQLGHVTRSNLNFCSEASRTTGIPTLTSMFAHAMTVFHSNSIGDFVQLRTATILTLPTASCRSGQVTILQDALISSSSSSSTFQSLAPIEPARISMASLCCGATCRAAPRAAACGVQRQTTYQVAGMRCMQAAAPQSDVLRGETRAERKTTKAMRLPVMRLWLC